LREAVCPALTLPRWTTAADGIIVIVAASWELTVMSRPVSAAVPADGFSACSPARSFDDRLDSEVTTAVASARTIPLSRMEATLFGVRAILAMAPSSSA
jgi:hypothetical protein